MDKNGLERRFHEAYNKYVKNRSDRDEALLTLERVEKRGYIDSHDLNEILTHYKSIVRVCLMIELRPGFEESSRLHALKNGDEALARIERVISEYPLKEVSPEKNT